MAIPHDRIAYCKIYPPIGIARVGNSQAADGVFIAPEKPGGDPHIFGAPTGTPFSYKDASGAIRRQAARFHVYAFDTADQLLGELCGKGVEITWSVELANKKAAWFNFSGAHGALSAFEAVGWPTSSAGRKLKLRNCDVEGDDDSGTALLELVEGGPCGRKWVASKEHGEEFEIHGPERSVCGPNRRHETGKQDLNFVGKFRRNRDVYLGELATDAEGRLVVMGGHGVSAPVDEHGRALDDPYEAWITHYANNDSWYDDTADGPVKAKVVLCADDGSRQPVEVQGAGWVVVTPPDFAPGTMDLVTLFDVMEEVADDHPSLCNKTTPRLRDPDRPDLRKDVWPIFDRMGGYRWVSKLGLRGHGQGRPGDILRGEPYDFQQFVKAASGKGLSAMGEAVMKVLRKPSYRRPGIHTASDEDMEAAARMATSLYMPPLSGDEGTRGDGEPGKWLSVTYLQMRRLQAWVGGRATVAQQAAATGEVGAEDSAHAAVASAGRRATSAGRDPGRHNGDATVAVEADMHGLERSKRLAEEHACLPEGSEPELLTRAVLESCCGGAFFPGIEITSIVREGRLYSEAFRFNDRVLEAGDISKYMALPWQADFFECQQNWWPAQRPDDVIHEDTFKKVFQEFTRAGTGNIADALERMLGERQRWDRGVGTAQPRPPGNFLVSRMLPKPRRDEKCATYFDKVAKIWTEAILGAATQEDGASPWRSTYLLQEACDRFAGRCFLPRLRQPEEVLKIDEIRKDHPELVHAYAIASLADLRAVWRDAALVTQGKVTGSLAAIAKLYSDGASRRMEGYFKACAVRSRCGAPAKGDTTPESFVEALTSVQWSTDEIDKRLRGEVLRDTQEYWQYALAEFRDAVSDAMYLTHTGTNGDNAMVTAWKDLGFVERRREILPDGSSLIVHVETGRDKFHGASLRDSFYRLMNIQDHQDFIPRALGMANEFLNYAQSVIDATDVFDDAHPETFVTYSKETFQAKLDEVYEIMRLRAQNTDIYWLARTRNRETELQVLRDGAPFNQSDGAWLRNISAAGAGDKVRALLFEVWSDEIGNGNPALHHGNLFTSLIRSVGIETYPLTSREYAYDPQFHESGFAGSVFELAISQHSDRFLPELLGMTLFLEWEVLSLVPSIKRRDYLGIDSHFWQMHVGIDNATNGHGAKARDAVMLYLDEVSHDGGNVAVQAQWKRIWCGYVAFAVAGGDMYGDDLGVSRRRPANAAARLDELIVRKAAYGAQNHQQHRIGRYRINDLFDDPELFRKMLAGSKWLVAGQPDASQFLQHLTTFNGPMYQIFSPGDLATWRDWIEWLGREGDTRASKRYYEKGEAMEALLFEMKSIAEGVSAHTRYRVEGDGRPTIAALFEGDDMRELMRRLVGTWAIPGDPAASPLVADMLRGDKPMGKALDRRFPRINNRIGRQIVIEWVIAGCPIPEQGPQGKVALPLKTLGPRLYMHTHGMGAVH